MSEYQVLIVGGGPVGLGLATELGLRGIRTALVERRSEPQLIPKGQNLTQRTMEHFRYWGVEAEIRAARVMPEAYPNAGVTAYRDLTSEYSFPWWRRSSVNEFYFASNERIPQYETERVLRRRLADLESVETFYGWSADELEADDAGVGILMSTAGSEKRLSAQWLVGCDGSHSTIRTAAGIEEDRSDHDRKMVLLVFRSVALNSIVSKFGEVSFFKIIHPDLDGYWKFLGRVDAEGRWFFHSPVGDEVVEDPSTVEMLLHDALGASFDFELEYAGLWDLRIAVARQYRKGRVFVAGDAAHSHPPYGGYGINTGLEDARNLAWKLAGVIDGWGGETLLDSYQQERLPVFRSTAEDFIAGFVDEDREFLIAHDPERDRSGFETAWEARRAAAGTGVADYEPHYEGSSLVFGDEEASSGAVGEHSFLARPGHHLPPAQLSGGSDLFAALGRGFALIALDSLPSTVAEWEKTAHQSGIPLSLIEDDARRGRARYGAKLILVRPDHYISWVGNAAPDDPAEILLRSVGAETAKTPAG